MSQIKKDSIDLYFAEDGDFVFDEERGDISTTKGEEFRCFQQSIVMRMENGRDEFGIASAFNSEFGFEPQSAFPDIFANLEDFHGLRLNDSTLSLIKQRVSRCLNSDLAFANVDHRVSVIKKSSDSVEILLMFLFPFSKSNGEMDQFILQYKGTYNSYNKSFGMFYRFDFSEYSAKRSPIGSL